MPAFPVAVPFLAALLGACGGSTDRPRPESGPAPALPGYLDPPSEDASDDAAPALDCSEREDIEIVPIEDFEFGAAGGGWYLSNDVCSVCRDFLNQADAIRNAGQATDRAAELAALAEQFDACVPGCDAVAPIPSYFDSSPLAEPIAGGRCGSLYALHIKGGPFLQWGGNFGRNFAPPLNATAVEAVDPQTNQVLPGQDLQGLTFWARLGGASNNTLRVEVGEMHTEGTYTGNDGGPICMPDTNDDNSELGCDKFGATAQMRGQWQQFLIPFAEMRQAGWGRRAEQFDLSRLLSFSLSYAQGTWDFWIDDLAFYRRRQ
jgi:hypothetical protein